MKVALLTLLSLSGCYAEWDVPVVPRHDPCTGRTDVGYVYVEPACRMAPPRNPRDLDYEPRSYR